MDRVEDIEAAIQHFPPEEDRSRPVVQWFLAREQTRWDEQMDRDSSAGKLDFCLFDEADCESAQEPIGSGLPPK